MVGCIIQSQSVEFWMQAMRQHVTSLRKKQDGSDLATWVSGLDSYVGLYFRFCSSQIAMISDWGAANRLTNILAEIQNAFPGLIGPIGFGLIQLFKVDMDSESDDAGRYADMGLSVKAEFFRSSVYKVYESRRWKHRHQKAKTASKTGTKPTEEELTALIDSSPDLEGKASVTWAKKYFTMPNITGQVELLFDEPGNYQYYLDWTEGEKLACIRPFVDTTTTWKAVPMATIIKGSHFLTGPENYHRLCKNPTVGHILRVFQELKSVLFANKTMLEAEKDKLQLVCRSLLMEAFRDRFGTEIPDYESSMEAARTALETVKFDDDHSQRLRLRKCLKAHMSRLKGNQFDSLSAACLAKLTTEEEKKQDELEAAEAKAASDKRDAEEIAAAAAKEAEAKALSEKFAVGAKVVTRLAKTAKNKDTWDNKNCEVVSIKRTGFAPTVRQGCGRSPRE